MKVVVAPAKVLHTTGPVLFLAGSIEEGRAVNWQRQVIEALEDLVGTILNPRRASWSPLDQDDLEEQIAWELNGLSKADLIFFYFDPDTMSPVSLLELGLYLRDWKHRLVVCCPEGYWRRTNVVMTCETHGRKVYDRFDSAMAAVAKELTQARKGTA